MPLFKKDDKQNKKKKSIPKKDILKVIKEQEYVDLGEPYGESARRYLTVQIGKLIDNEEISGSVIIPEGVYISMSATEIKDVVRLIKAKGICSLDEIAKNNNWNKKSIYLIANNRINLIQRIDGQVITRNTAFDLVYQEANRSTDVEISKIAEELQLKETVIKELLNNLIEDGRLDGLFIKSSNKFLPMELLEESIKELIEEYEMKDKIEITFLEIAEEYGITEEHVYNILLKLYNVGDIDVQLNLGQKTCIIKSNIEEELIKERIPEEEKKLDIEDLTEKK